MKTLIPLAAAAFLIAGTPATAPAATPALGEVTFNLFQEVKHGSRKHWRGQNHWHKRHAHPPRHSHKHYNGPPPHSRYQGPPPHSRANSKWRHPHSPRQHYRVPSPGGLHLHFSFPD